MKKLRLDHRFAFGDTVMFTAMVRDIAKTYPGEYEVHVHSNFSPIWWNNPYVASVNKLKRKDADINAEIRWKSAIRCDGICDPVAKKYRHLLAWYHHDFSRKTGIPLNCLQPRGDLYLSAEEMRPMVSGRYWLFLSGGKLDVTIKHYPREYYQQVVDLLASVGLQSVQTGFVGTGHIHPPLTRVTNLLGQSNSPRDLINLVANADGVIGPLTAAMHIAAVYDRPYVCLAGGREGPWLSQYTNQYHAFGEYCEPVKVDQKFLTAIGQLECCRSRGCWRNRVVPIEKKDLEAKRRHLLCVLPDRTNPEQPIATCMRAITPSQVFQACLDYYADGTLPPP